MTNDGLMPRGERDWVVPVCWWLSIAFWTSVTLAFFPYQPCPVPYLQKRIYVCDVKKVNRIVVNVYVGLYERLSAGFNDYEGDVIFFFSKKP